VHILISGRTLHGKSTLAKARCRAFNANGIETIVIDPTCDPAWNATLQFRDQTAFLRAYWASESCAVFLDEGSKSVGKYNLNTEETATLGRHRGHINHYIVQRVTQIPPTVRDQCTELFLFSSSTKDGHILAEEYGFDALRECNELAKGEYFHASLETKTCIKKSVWKGAKNATTDSTGGHRSDGNRSRVADARGTKNGSGEAATAAETGTGNAGESGRSANSGGVAN
jgi:hypothetical protein